MDIVERLKCQQPMRGVNYIEDAINEIEKLREEVTDRGELVGKIRTLKSEKHKLIKDSQDAADRYEKTLMEMHDYQMDIAAELAELKAAQEWQPIETAPKDGTIVLLHIPNMPAVSCTQAFYGSTFCPIEQVEQEEHWRNASTDHQVYRTATHWRPLPSAPKEGEL